MELISLSLLAPKRKGREDASLRPGTVRQTVTSGDLGKLATRFRRTPIAETTSISEI